MILDAVIKLGAVASKTLTKWGRFDDRGPDSR
jgi:hypothetical protein